MGNPEFWLIRGSASACGNKGFGFRKIFSLNEQFRKGRMGKVCVLCQKRKFSIGCDINFLRLMACVGERKVADFSIIFR
ncbi:hypothetical protein Amal_03707 [Acetobacter malorum]|uniref:Uncharacterized protein n=1 Tax=Acetobacter malorum TaxID=178901 RepID=A0A177G5R1_9PROT|nr:hypothetical protein Amal_03707 [Acetobacter malorum]